LFLNKTCYNGLYRVNQSGKFNVPHGRYTNPTICNTDGILKASDILNKSNARIVCEEYGVITGGCNRGDIVYLDPPYFPLSKTSNFKDYTKQDFGVPQQIALAMEFRRLDDIGCTVLVSNSNCSFICQLYKDYAMLPVVTSRLINCNASNRKSHQELLIFNKFNLTSAIEPKHSILNLKSKNFCD
jgi:DNA adenine methylase